MLLQTNSYIVPKDKRAEHARLLACFRQSLAKHGCEHFEAYEQVGPNWGGTESTGRFVQIMRFRDRKHQQQVQAAEREDPSAQQLIKEFCDLINFPYQQQQGFFASGFYNSVLAVGPMRTPSPVEPVPPPPPIRPPAQEWAPPVAPPPIVPPIAAGMAVAAAVAASTYESSPPAIVSRPPPLDRRNFPAEPPPPIVEIETPPIDTIDNEPIVAEPVASAPQTIEPEVAFIEPPPPIIDVLEHEPIASEPVALAPQVIEPEDAFIEPPPAAPAAENSTKSESAAELEAFEDLPELPDDISGDDIAPPLLATDVAEEELPPPMVQSDEPVLDMSTSEISEPVIDDELQPPPLDLMEETESQDDDFGLEVPRLEDEPLPLDPEIDKH